MITITLPETATTSIKEAGTTKATIPKQTEDENESFTTYYRTANIFRSNVIILIRTLG